MTTPPFDAVLFDLDGVLLDSEQIASAVWVELLAEHGLHFSLPEWMALATGSTHRDLFAWLHSQRGWERPAGFTEELDARLMDAFGHTPRVEGALETLQALQASGVPFAVASNSLRSRLHRKTTAAGIAGLLGPHAYDPAHVAGRGKPLPDLYEYAAHQLGADVRRCLVIEDSRVGAQAGLAAGATVWGLLAAGHHPDDERTLRDLGVQRLLRSHAELQQALGLPRLRPEVIVQS